MIPIQSSRRNIALFLLAFLACGILRVLLYPYNFVYGLSSLFCGALTLFWSISMQSRVTDRRLRRMML